MQYEITHRPSYAQVDLSLETGDTIRAEAGAMVSHSGGIDVETKAEGGLKSTLFSGEGLVCEFTGEGRVWTQTRSPEAFLSWLIPQLPTNNSSN